MLVILWSDLSIFIDFYRFLYIFIEATRTSHSTARPPQWHRSCTRGCWDKVGWCDCASGAAPAAPGVGGSIRRFTFFTPSAVRGGPPLTLFTKYDYLRFARGLCQNGRYERVALTKKSVWSCLSVVFDDISSIGATPVAFGRQNRSNRRKDRIFEVISPVWFPQGSKPVEY